MEEKMTKNESTLFFMTKKMKGNNNTCNSNFFITPYNPIDAIVQLPFTKNESKINVNVKKKIKS